MAVYNINGNVLSELYDKDGMPISSAYDIDGKPIFNGSGIDYNIYTVQTSYLNSGVANDQGFDVYGGYIFQFRAGGTGDASGNRVAVIDLSTGSVVNQFAITADHGDSAYFSKQFYSPSDQFPLIYVSADTSPYVYINRVTTSSATLIQTLKFDYAVAGYNPNCAFDEANQIMYMVGTTENNWQSDMGGLNKTLVSKWDASSLINNGDGTYTPTFISSYQIPFIYVMQGIRFYDGMIWIPSGYGGSQSYIYVIDPADGTYLYTFDLNTTAEVEGTAFISANQMLVGFGGGRYDLYTFALT